MVICLEQGATDLHVAHRHVSCFIKILKHSGASLSSLF